MTTTNKRVHQLVDPTTSAIVPEFTLSPRLDSLTNKKMGLINDAKTNAKELLGELAEFLKAGLESRSKNTIKNHQQGNRQIRK